MTGQRTDVGKIAALKKAGWGTEQIAEEMRMTPQDMEQELSKYGDGKPEKTEAGRVVLVSLPFEQLKEIYENAAAIGAKEALKTFRQERENENGRRGDRRLRNTKLLLRNYRMLKEHAENSVFGRTQMEESAFDILESMMSMYDNEVIIESIKRSATRTAVIVSHIETMFGLYAAYCDKAANRYIEKRRYEVLWDLYMADETLSVKELAKKYHISKDSVYSDLRMATERLTALIFGVDGLNVQ